MTGAAERHCRVAMSFPPDATSVRLARDFCATTLTAWELHEAVDDAVHVVSELVTAAVSSSAREFEVLLTHVEGHLDITVRGHGAGRTDPSVSEDDPALRVTSAVSAAWAVGIDGDAAWSRIRVPAQVDIAPERTGPPPDPGTGVAEGPRPPAVDQGERAASLTDRHVLLSRLERAIARTRASGPADLAVVVIDLDADQMESINDVYGHETADGLLVQAMRELAGVAPQGVTRTSGSQFVAIVEGADQSQAVTVAERLLARISSCFDVSSKRFYVHGRAGIAVSGCATAEELLRQAHAAAHQARRSGRGRVVVFDHDVTTRTAERLSLLADLRQALEEDQLELHYQPVVDLRSGRITGVEALLRWSHARRGAVPPGDVIRAAQEGGLCHQLDRWVLDRAASQYRAISTALGRDATVAVNISASGLSNGGVEQAVRESLQTHGMPGRGLVLEITEGAVMDDPQRARSVLEDLRRAGVSVALDDFGTGYSSLAQLTRFPIQHVKIDRCFVQEIVTEPDARRLASSIIEMAHGLRMTAVAEGVETPQQVQLLRSFGCDAGQGFLWSPAVPVGALDEIAGVQPLQGCGAPADDLPRTRRRGSGVHLLPDGLEETLTRLTATGASPATIAAALNSAGLRTPAGKRWHHVTVTAELLRTRAARPLLDVPAQSCGPVAVESADEEGAGHGPASEPTRRTSTHEPVLPASEAHVHGH